MGLLIDAHNELSDRSHVRAAIRTWLAGCTEYLAKGVVVLPDGSLDFDARRYSVALWRAKQSRYANEALDLLKKTVREVASVNDCLGLEHDAFNETGLDGVIVFFVQIDTVSPQA